MVIFHSYVSLPEGNLLSMKPCVTHLCAVPCYINPEMTRYNANDIPNGILMKYPHVCCLPEAKLT